MGLLDYGIIRLLDCGIMGFMIIGLLNVEAR